MTQQCKVCGATIISRRPVPICLRCQEKGLTAPSDKMVRVGTPKANDEVVTK
jgi:hypothetical protein